MSILRDPAIRVPLDAAILALLLPVHSEVSCNWCKCRYEALEVRMDALKGELRPTVGAPPELLAQHAAEIESLTMQIATVQVGRSAGRHLCTQAL